MVKKYRAEKVRFLNDDRKTTRVVYLPQVKFGDDWRSFPDEGTPSGTVEHKNKEDALDNAKILYEHYHAKGHCYTVLPN